MTDEQQRIAIAEACGWTHLTKAHYDHLWVKPGSTADDYPLSGNENVGYPPDYLNDLNAMAEAFWTLTYNQRVEFLYRLGDVLGTPNRNNWILVDMVNATARQRLEAILKTLNLWTE